MARTYKINIFGQTIEIPEYIISKYSDEQLRTVLEAYLKDNPITEPLTEEETVSLVNTAVQSAITLTEIDDETEIEPLVTKTDVLSLLPYVTPEQFGAVGDGVTDDTDAIQGAIDYATKSKPYVNILIPNKYYRVSSLSLKTGTHLIGNSGNTVTNGGGYIKFVGDVALQYDTNIEDIIFKDITVIGIGTNTLVDNTNNQVKYTKFINVDIHSFDIAFRTIVLFCSLLDNVQINYVNSFGVIRGTDNFIRGGLWGINTGNSENTNEYALNLNMNISIIENIYFTFSDKDGVNGTTNAILFNECNDLKLSKCIYTQSKGHIQYNNGSVQISESTFKSMGMNTNIMHSALGDTKLGLFNNTYEFKNDCMLYKCISPKTVLKSSGNIIKSTYGISNSVKCKHSDEFSILSEYTSVSSTDITFTDYNVDYIHIGKADANITSISLYDIYEGKIIYLANDTSTVVTVLGKTLNSGEIIKLTYLLGKWSQL